ncbi:MAG TPA: hypothetical protein VKU19_00015 [Bryobacteraceae bacterium]|nr:hypothetical protein [Bryobacteraceae bacterium]
MPLQSLARHVSGQSEEALPSFAGSHRDLASIGAPDILGEGRSYEIRDAIMITSPISDTAST